MPTDAQAQKPAHPRGNLKIPAPVQVAEAESGASLTYKYVWRNFESWCAANRENPTSGFSALEKYVATLLQKELPLKTVRLYVGGICRGAEEAGIAISKGDPRMEALFAPFIERHKELHPRRNRG